MRWDLTFILLESTLSEWISGVPRNTSTRRQVIDNLADGIEATSSGTGVFAFVVDASEVGRTIRVQNAFWSAAFVGVSDIVGLTSTSTSSVLFFADCIGATRTGRAGSCYFDWIVLSDL